VGDAVTRVRQWKLEGNASIDTEQLLKWLEPFTNVDLSIRQINEAAAIVQQAYTDAGWLARVVVPAQDITEGTVLLRVVEGRLARVLMDAAAQANVDLELVRSIVQGDLQQGDVLRTDLVARGVLLADDLAGVSVAASYQPGEQEGTTDVVVLASPEPHASFNVSVDNASARSVGTDRVIANLTFNSLFGRGETLNAVVAHTQGSDYLRLGANVPVGRSGLKVSPYASHMDYKVITPDDQGRPQNIKGKVDVYGIDASYPIIRQPQHNLYLQAGWRNSQYQSYANGVLDNRFRIQAGSIGLQGNVIDNWGGGGLTTFSLAYHEGRKKSIPLGKDMPNSEGGFHKWAWAIGRQQALRPGLTLYASLQGQDTGNKPLDSSENMSLGGSSGVRAYPSGEGSGPKGRLAQLELRWRPNAQWQITPFYDYGRVSKRQDGPPEYSLKGHGLSVAWNGPQGWNAQVTYARRQGQNPHPTDKGKDQDGTLYRERFWLNVSKSF
jgi:hemolysin activation/secretion protein